jgi:glycerol-3-phosphate O-acyltransferase
MSTYSPKLGFFAALKLSWLMLLRAILHWWVKARTLPDPIDDLNINREKPVCYIIDSYALSTLLILDRSCESLNLPRPLLPMPVDGDLESRAYLALRRKKGLIVRRTTPRTHSKSLKRLVDRVYENPESDIQMVPATVLVGRAADKETRLAKIFFTESWEVAGRLRRFVSTLINGRNTFVQLSQPISLRELADENIGADRSLRKVSRILRVHFRNVRSAAIGPDLSHRRMVVDQILTSPSVRSAIAEKSRKEGISELKAWKRARSYAYEISADYSNAFVRIASFALSWFWTKIYDGVELQHFSKFRKIAPAFEVIYVPCHRSHMDYLLVSYFLYHHGFVPPHIAAGVNLNLPVVGGLVRRGGAFFLRRSFRAQKLYSAVFHEYVSRIQSQGTSIEYFIEGTRSRTGRLLPPKGGMLSMTVRGFLKSPNRPVMFQPIYIGYERLVEGKSYTAELSGQGKKSESLRDLFKVFGILRQRYGKVHVSFAEPVFLDDLLERHDPDWRQNTLGEDQKPVWLNALTDELGTQIMTCMNEAAHVNAINMLAGVLLATSKHAMGESELISQLNLYLNLLERCTYSERITYTEKSAEEIIQYGIELDMLQSREHPLGNILALNPDRAVLQTYFRNNISHLMALPSLVASCFLNSRSIRKDRLQAIASLLYPFLKSELFLPWDEEGFQSALDDHIDWLLDRKLLTVSDDEEVLRRAEGGSHEAMQLEIIGQGLLQTFERYYITLTVLAKNGSGTLTRAELERLCMLTAQRISQLSEFAAPEFYDRNLFKHFIDVLRSTGALRSNPEGKLEFDDSIERFSADARVILGKEIRHGIIRVAPQVLQDTDNEKAEN